MSLLTEKENCDARVPHEKHKHGAGHRNALSDVTDNVLPVNLVNIRAETNEKKFEIKKPAQKLTLVKKLNSRSKSHADKDLEKCSFDEQYIQDIIRYLLYTEKKFVYRKQDLDRNADLDHRILVVNWLINVHNVLGLREQTLFVTIRMFDCLIASFNIINKKYLLVGLCCMWIANKNIDVQLILVPKLIAACQGKFSKPEFLSAERKVLKALRFNVNFPEPVSFLFYYLKRENMENDRKIRCSAMFLLENFTLLLDFSSMTPSLLAAIALYLVLEKYDIDCESFLRYIEAFLLNKEQFMHKKKKMLRCLECIWAEKSFENEVVSKYAKQEMCCVAYNFISR